MLYDFFNLGYFYKSIKYFNIFIGVSYLQRLDSSGLLFALFSFLKTLFIPYSNLHVISLKMGRLSAFEFNLISSSLLVNYTHQFIGSNISQFVYLCGVDLDSLYIDNKANVFLTFQGSFCDKTE